MTKYKCYDCNKPLLSEGTCIACKQKSKDKWKTRFWKGSSVVIGTVVTGAAIEQSNPGIIKGTLSHVTKIIKK